MDSWQSGETFALSTGDGRRYIATLTSQPDSYGYGTAGNAGRVLQEMFRSTSYDHERPYASGLSAPFASGSGQDSRGVDAVLLLGSSRNSQSTAAMQRRVGGKSVSGKKGRSLSSISGKAMGSKSFIGQLRVAQCPVCVDQHLVYPSNLWKDERISCSVCGQMFTREMLVSEVAPSESGLSDAQVWETYQATFETTCGATSQTVVSAAAYSYQQYHGVTIYECKLLSPLLSRYRLNFNDLTLERMPSASAANSLSYKELSTMDFRLESSLSDTPRYGVDMTGSLHYLRPTLDSILPENDQEDRLVSQPKATNPNPYVILSVVHITCSCF